jgi:hypothetical protein
MSTAVSHFAKLDDSTRPNILLNCSQLKYSFEEEDMKTIDYDIIIKKRNTDIIPIQFYFYNCNFVVYIKKDVELALLSEMNKFISIFNPIFIITICTSDQIETLLQSKSYKFMDKIKLFYMYKYTENNN